MTEQPRAAQLPINQVLVGDCREVMQAFPPESIDLAITSPPYWSLRDYGAECISVYGGNPRCQHEWSRYKPKFGNMGGGANRKEVTPNYRDNLGPQDFCVWCGAFKGQLGLEHNPSLYVQHLVQVYREMRRVLKKAGSFYLNIGDTYASSGTKRWDEHKYSGKTLIYAGRGRIVEYSSWLQPKQLLGIPWRVAIALQEDAWILRNAIIWNKPNHMPSSVKDRLTNAYEHIFHFVKNRKYYYDLDAIRERPISVKASGNKQRKPSLQPHNSHVGRSIPWSPYKGKFNGFEEESEQYGGDVVKGYSPHEPRHFELLAMKGVTSGGHTGKTVAHDHPDGKNPADFWSINTKPFKKAHFATFPEAICEMPIKSSCPLNGVVLDPMCGSGSALVTAKKLGRNYIGIDMVPAYAKMSIERLESTPEPDKE